MNSKYLVSFVDIVNNFFGMEWMGEATDEVSALVKAKEEHKLTNWTCSRQFKITIEKVI